MSSCSSTRTSTRTSPSSTTRQQSRATPVENYFQKLGKEGLADIEAVEVDWLAEVLQYSDLLAPVPDDLKGRWLDWKEAAATGRRRQPRRLRHRHRPAGDLLPRGSVRSSRPAEHTADVEALFDGDWSNYFDVADQYKAATGKAMIDAANSVLQGIVNQMEYTYDEPDGTVIATSNPELQAAYDSRRRARCAELQVLEAVGRRLERVELANGEFATLLCPAWMQGIISGTAPDVDGAGKSPTSSPTAAATGAVLT